MKYLKYIALLVALLALNGALWGQEPCKDLPVKTTEGEVLNLPTVVTPVDVQTPLGLNLTCPQNISVNLVLGETSSIVTWEDAEGETDCPIGGISVNQTSGAPSGSSFSEGSYVIEYQATDNCGNTGVCNFTVWLGHYDPTVIFVHGLGGSVKSWLSASEWQEQKYACQQERLEYIQASGLTSAGADLKEQLISAVSLKMGNAGGNPNSKEERRRNFIIAHSQGGVVSQVMEKLMREGSNPNDYWSWENRYYGGLVTFGSPHQGAYIMNSLIEDNQGNLLPLSPNCSVNLGDSRVGDFVHDAEDQLLPAIIAENVNLKGLPKLFETSISNAVEGVAKALGEPLVLNYLIGGQAVNCTTRGFALGSSEIFGQPTYQRDNDGNIIVDANGIALNPESRGGLDAFFEYNGAGTPSLEAPLPKLENTIPKVAFYGEIDDESTQGELLWRVGFWQKNSVNTDSDPNGKPDGINGFGQMGANMPLLEDGQKDANEHKAQYFALAEANRVLADKKWKWIPFFGLTINLIRRHQAKNLYDKSTAFRKGALWYETANDKYKTLIGATTYEVTSNNCYCECEETDYDDQGNAGEVVGVFQKPLSDCDQSCDQYEYSNHIECKKRVSVDVFEKQSDGVALAESAANMAGATVTENTPGYSKEDFVMHGSIHMQMRNDKNLEVKLKKLYTGFYDKQFELKLK